MLQASKLPFAFIEVICWFCWWSVCWWSVNQRKARNSYESIRLYLACHPWLFHFGPVFIKYI